MPDLRLDIADETEGSLSHSLKNSPTNSSQQNEKLFKDIKEELGMLNETLMAKQKQQEKDAFKETEKKKLWFRKALATAAVGTTACAVAFIFGFPKVVGALAVILTFLQIMQQFGERSFEDRPKKVKETITAYSSNTSGKIKAFEENLKAEFESQNVNLALNANNGIQEIRDMIDDFDYEVGSLLSSYV